MLSLRILTVICLFAVNFNVNAVTVDSVCDINSGADIIGAVMDKDNKEPLYCEYHYDKDEAGTSLSSVVKYIDTEGQQIAEKQLNYDFMSLAPDVLQQDSRQGELRSIQYSEENNHFLLEYQKNTDSEKKSAAVKIQEDGLPVVADAGFDRFIRESWDPLLSKQPVSFSFLSPVHTRNIDLRVKIVEPENCGDLEFNAEESACFTVRPKSSVLKMFAKPLHLIYDKSSRRLSVFSGVVNLVDTEGRAQAANIYYWYKRNL